MIWKKRGQYTTFEEYVIQTAGVAPAELHLMEQDRGNCPGLAEAARMMRETAAAGGRICVVGDYDADGIDALCIFYYLLRKLGAKMTLLVPRRISEGYGFSGKILKRVPADTQLLITVDNGISSAETIAQVKADGRKVIVIDHHELLPGTDGAMHLPPADLVIDPIVLPEGWSDTHYCGAGLSYLLAEEMFPDDPGLLDLAAGFAAVGTIADVVPLNGKNRRIVRRGLRSINENRCAPGLRELADVVGRTPQDLNARRYLFKPIDAETVGYYIAPVINAYGRLEDDGGRSVLYALLSAGKDAGRNIAFLMQQNQRRRQIVEEIMECFHPQGDHVRLLYAPGIPEGVCGLLAGRYAESGCAAFVMTDAADGGVKGSARRGTDNPQSVLELLEHCRGLVQFGGHAGAAGFHLKKEEKDVFLNLLEAHAVPFAAGEEKCYDLEPESTDLAELYACLKEMEPFGEGFPKPVLRVRAHPENVRVLGAGGDTVKFSIGPGLTTEAIAFHRKDALEQALRCGSEVILYGQLKPNYFGIAEPIRETMQFNCEDIQPVVL